MVGALGAQLGVEVSGMGLIVTAVGTAIRSPTTLLSCTLSSGPSRYMPVQRVLG